MLGIVVLLVLITLGVVFYQGYMKCIQLDLSIASLEAQIASLDAQIIEKLHELRMKQNELKMKQLEIDVIKLKLAELEKRCQIENVR